MILMMSCTFIFINIVIMFGFIIFIRVVRFSLEVDVFMLQYLIVVLIIPLVECCMRMWILLFVMIVILHIFILVIFMLLVHFPIAIVYVSQVACFRLLIKFPEIGILYPNVVVQFTVFLLALF